MHLIRRPTDFISGLIFFVVAALALAMGSQYVLGTARNMGPGSYPLLVGSLLGLVSLVLIARSFAGPRDEPISLALRPMLIVAAGILIFALVLMQAGLFLAIIALVLISASASGQLRPFKAIILAVGLSVACCAIFVYGLGQQLPIFGHWLTSFTG
ncbi:MAG: tripartite tricarboxylate transporter TctB family protein [Devosia sp.]